MKKKRILSLLLTAALVLALLPTTAFAADPSVIWDGTVDTAWYDENPAASEYTLHEASELAGLAKLVNNKRETFSGKTIKLGADIVLNDTSDLQNWGTAGPPNIWTPIGYYVNINENFPFMGTFDGQGHTVSGIYFNDYGRYGLFGGLNGANILNLGIKDSRIQGGYYVGALASYVMSGTNIAFCWSEAPVFGYAHVGGLVGALNGTADAPSSLSYCYNSGDVSANTDYPGGIAGVIYADNRIVRCFNTGAVTGRNSGGVAGDCQSGDIYNSYYMTITGSASSGVGYSTGGDINIRALTDTECKNGKLAYLINSDQTLLGHTTLNGTEFPQLSAFHDSLKYAVRVSFYDNTTLCVQTYALKGSSFDGSGAGLPPDPTHSSYRFEGWKTSSDGSGTDFTSSTAVMEDMTVYARWSYFAGGGGSENDPYRIETPQQLRAMAEAVNSDNAYFGGKHYKLDGDINLGADWIIDETTSGASLTTGEAWTPIGTYNISEPQKSSSFKGTFDGNGYTISGVYINSSDGYQGLFGYVQGGCITDLTIGHSYLRGDRFTGGISGYFWGDSKTNVFISNCHIGAGVRITGTGSDGWTGGICGYFGAGTITACTNAGSVSGSLTAVGNVGGISGFIYNGTVSESFNSGTISGTNNIGGIAGGINSNSGVQNSFNTGAITGSNRIGGIAGDLGSDVSVLNSFNTGSITGKFSNSAGGVAGSLHSNSNVSDSYYLEGSAAAGIGGVSGGSGTAVVKTEAEFTNGEVAYLLQAAQTSLLWGHIALDGSELPRLAALNSTAKKVLRVRFYDDAAESGTFLLHSTVYTLMGGSAAFPALTDVTWIDNANQTYTESSAFSADTDLYTRRTVGPAASIVSIEPAVLTEAAANDGSLASGAVAITIENGMLVPDIAKTDVTASNLPSGLDYSTTRTDDTHLTILISGNAVNHASANDVNNLTFTIAQAKVTGAAGNLTTASISIDFYDPAQVDDATISPTSFSYDLSVPADVLTEIRWNSAGAVTNMVYSVSQDTSLYMLNTSDYTVNGNELTIKNGFFSGLSLTTGDVLGFQIAFDTGAAAALTVKVVDSSGGGYTPSSNANLGSLSVNGTPISGFDPDVITYNVKLPYGTSGATISAAASDAYAHVGITPASSLPGSATVTVTAEDRTTKTYTINITIEAAPVTMYTVTFHSNGSVYATKTVNAGESIGSTGWPADPARSGYTFGGWFTGANGSGTQFVSTTPVNAAMTVYAKWTYRGGGNGGGSSNSSKPATSTYNADVDTGNGTETTLPVIVDRKTASVDAGSQKLGQGGFIVTIPSIPNVDTYSVGLPLEALSTTARQGTLTLHTGMGSVTVPSNMLTGIAGISGSKAEISIGQGDKSTLPEDLKTAIGDKPLIRLTLLIDGKRTGWSNSNAPATVSIPYIPTTVELANSESIVIWYIDGSGNAIPIPNGHYDPLTGTVTFITTHFSDYAVAYDKADFRDVPAGAWYKKAVSFIAARSITSGTGNGCYNPEANLTRGEFIVLIMRAYGIAPDTNPADNFSDAGKTYYSDYLAAAKRFGISEGIGNNMYMPGKEITRQEMFTLLYNTLKVIGQLPEADTGKTLSSFTDAGQIDTWAKEAITRLVKAGIVGGSNGKLTATGTTTRAEMAQVLYNLLGK